uniref:Uncharacterized protein n=1 Tax=Lactuca sativa TaxID=4236 RepID=A0A9R1UZP0_LACSA|nr:hypothetical protein LSAT_V11C700376190 [Lactuca sativa]
MAVNKCLVAVVELEGKESGATGWVSVYGINEKDGDGLPVAVIADRVAASISSNPNLLWQFNQSKLLTLQQKTNKQPTSQEAPATVKSYYHQRIVVCPVVEGDSIFWIDLQVVPHFEFSVKNPHDVWDGKNMDYVMLNTVVAAILVLKICTGGDWSSTLKSGFRFNPSSITLFRVDLPVEMSEYILLLGSKYWCFS